MTRRGGTRSRGWTTVVAVAAAVAACEAGLTTDGGKEIDFDRGALLQSLADNVVAPTFQEVQKKAAALEAATSQYATAVDSGSADVDAARDAARQAWMEMAGIWQRAEVLQLGPAGSSVDAIGGADLRDEIYSWPTVNTCRVDQEVVAGEYAADGFFDVQLINVYGLDAVEYLLFNDAAGHTCASQVGLDDAWTALGEMEVRRRRAAYAAAAAGDIRRHADALLQAWAPGSGEWTVGLARPGEGTSAYGTDADALDEIMRAMFHADVVLKDLKLGCPAGLVTDVSCPGELESPWAARSKEHVIANLEGLLQIMWGGPSADAGVGFDEFMQAAGEDVVAAEMVGALQDAIAAAQAIDGTFAEALAADPRALDPIHGAVKVFTDHLKGTFATCLALQLPNEGGGDAD